MHLVPVIVVLAILYYTRATKQHQERGEFISLALACMWVWLGPILIWYYERYTLPRFSRQCRALVSQRGQYKEIRDLVYTNIYKNGACIFITITWIAAASSLLFSKRQIIWDLGVSGKSDPFLWIIGIGFVLVAFYTSIGLDTSKNLAVLAGL